MALANQAIAIADDPRTRAAARIMKARLEMWNGIPGQIIHDLTETADAVALVDERQAAVAMTLATAVGYLAGDIPAAVRRGVAAGEAAARAGDFVTELVANAHVAWHAFLAGDLRQYDQRLDRMEPLMRALLDQQSCEGIRAADPFCMVWVMSEQWELVDALQPKVLHLARSIGLTLCVAFEEFIMGSLAWRRGRWSEAYAYATHYLDETTLPAISLCWGRCMAAQITSTMGRVEETRQLLDDAIPDALARDIPIVLASAYAALGHLELSLGHNEEALTLLDRVAEITERIGLVEPGFLLWHGDHLEALVRLGLRREAQGRVDALELVAHQTGRNWAFGVLARVKGQLAAPHRRDAYFAESESIFIKISMPFELARTQVVRGGDGTPSARRIFHRLGATLWADAARSSSVAADPSDAAPTIETQAEPGLRISEVLTPAELRVALAVVSGRTNRQIATELYVSPKTVDFHLQKMFRKLSVRNRTELATKVARDVASPVIVGVGDPGAHN